MTIGRVSVIVPNYNYAHFVSDAVSSALALDWPDVEVIVVDDGSTDDSWTVITSFGDRITAVRQENAGPREACNAGFAIATGEVVIFLDSDDVLRPSIIREVDAVWRPGVSKVQVQLQRIDRDGSALGEPYPDFGRRPSPEKMRAWIRATSEYPTPPGSGNIYPRSFLERLFPLDDRCGNSTDSATLAAAPFLGDVLSISKPLVEYRIHGGNRSNLLTDPSGRFPLQITRAYQRHLFSLDFSGPETTASPLAPLFRGPHLLQMRIAERRFNAGRPTPIPTDSRWRMFRNALTVPGSPGPESLPHRLLVTAWCLVALAAPGPVARRVIALRFGR